ncbi:hypothetical protein SAMN05192563_1004191 [Paraburkholderia aspalathi]|uniref:Uncharacterized protein n=1 Tax=Paraburkholderia aspalathi TaxID=1324617 RepID=A0A1I7B5F6_9BURK|nr:hypothetical protein SAMN05192563_1004191 [Paraburkholderia aspalathi]
MGRKGIEIVVSELELGKVCTTRFQSADFLTLGAYQP